ncbi:MAG: metallophosphoesterase family protein [Bacteroidota bacterium]|nr:metallophosphoesterase family protein [Bacteroidota bacterium]
MLIAIISDIHGNLEALMRVFEDMDALGIDRIVCLGDIIGYGADPSACLSLIRRRVPLVLMGNHEEATFNPATREWFSAIARHAIEWTIRHLSEEERAWIRQLPYTTSFEGSRFVHAAPKHPERWDYVMGRFEALTQAEAFSERLCFIGHSHIAGLFPLEPNVRKYNTENRFLINPGSVGQPRDGDPRASYGILDTVAGTYENRRVSYPIHITARKIRSAGLPPFLADRLSMGH